MRRPVSYLHKLYSHDHLKGVDQGETILGADSWLTRKPLHKNRRTPTSSTRSPDTETPQKPQFVNTPLSLYERIVNKKRRTRTSAVLCRNSNPITGRFGYDPRMLSFPKFRGRTPDAKFCKLLPHSLTP